MDSNLKTTLTNLREKFQDKLENGQIVPRLAKNLSPVSLESGATQETPFVLQGTGTANGTASVDTADVGKHLEKQGNSVVANQIVDHGNFDASTGWSAVRGTFAVSNNIGTYTIDALTGSDIESHRIQKDLEFINNHYYILCIYIKTPHSCLACIASTNAGISYSTFSKSVSANTWTFISRVAKATSSGTFTTRFSFNGYLSENGFEIGNEILYKNAFVVDLTQMFGSNANIPQDLLDHPENFYRYYNGSLDYNTGNLDNSIGRYLQTGGRNVWDEKWELGGYSFGSGNTINSQTYQNRIRSKSTNYIRVIPGATYYIYRGSNNNGNWCPFFYDKNYNYVGSLNNSTQDTSYNMNTTFVVPSNACYLRFYITSVYGTTYKNDISISLYYVTGDNYNKYYPYETPKNYDTGTEVLRSVPKYSSPYGFIRDTKVPSGLITRYVGFVDLGSLTWTYHSASGSLSAYFDTNFSGYKSLGSDTPANMICKKYQISQGSRIALNDTDGFISGNAGGNKLFICDSNYTDETTFKNSLNGVYLFYELATPTTEQGTPFAENIEINDYGTMSWLDTNDAYVGIPQGCKIFYPADTALFIDSLGQRTDINWDANELVSHTELTTDKTELQGVDTQLKNAIGGTLRNCLAIQESGVGFGNTDYVDLGSLNWYYYDTGHLQFQCSQLASIMTKPSSSSAKPKALCTLYDVVSPVDYNSNRTVLNMTINETTGYIFVHNSNYTNANDFQKAMKGVILAYVKAS